MPREGGPVTVSGPMGANYVPLPGSCQCLSAINPGASTPRSCGADGLIQFGGAISDLGLCLGGVIPNPAQFSRVRISRTNCPCACQILPASKNRSVRMTPWSRSLDHRCEPL